MLDHPAAFIEVYGYDIIDFSECLVGHFASYGVSFVVQVFQGTSYQLCNHNFVDIIINDAFLCLSFLLNTDQC